MKWIFCAALLFALGCNSGAVHHSGAYLPKFGNGDRVRLTDAPETLYVIHSQYINDKWFYDVSDGKDSITVFVIAHIHFFFG